MGQHHHYIPSPPSPPPPSPPPTLPVPPAFQSPPVPIVNPTTPTPAPTKGQDTGQGGGNGMPYCSGPNSPGYNVSTGKCENNPVHAIVPTERASSTSTLKVLRLDALPYTGSNDIAYFTFMGALLVFSIVTAYYITRAVYRT